MSIDDYLPNEMAQLEKERTAQLEADKAPQRAISEFLPIGKRLHREAKEHGLPFDEGPYSGNEHCYSIDPFPDGVDQHKVALYLHPTGQVLTSPTSNDRSYIALVGLRRMMNGETDQGVVFHKGKLYWKGRKHRSIDEAVPLEQVIARDLARKIAKAKVQPY